MSIRNFIELMTSNNSYQVRPSNS